MKKLSFLVVLLSGIISVSLLTGFVSGAITYTETTPSDFPVLAPVDTWNPYNITADKGVPFNAVAEILAYDQSLIAVETVGVREVGSSNARYLLMAEAEGGGKTLSRFLVNVNGSGIIEIYGSRTGTTYSGFTLVGYWMDVTFTEQWVSYAPTSAEDNQWHETDGAELSLSANRTHLITVTNDDEGKEYIGGVRNTTSLKNRYVAIMEAEGGGVQTATIYVVADSDSKIEVWSGMFDDITFYNQGYFDDTLDFHENWGWTNTMAVGWNTWDLSWDTDEPERVVDYVLSHFSDSAELLIGVRTNGSILERRLWVRESEGGGYSCMGISVQTDSNSVIELYASQWIPQMFTFTGYFEPLGPFIEITDVTLLFGAGFNHSVPYVYLEWNHAGLVDNYEILHSTDGVSFSILNYTVQKYYNHSALVFGDYHYYKVRVTYFTEGQWFNSSYTPTNLERVWFNLGVAGVEAAPFGLYFTGLLSLIIILASLIMGRGT